MGTFDTNLACELAECLVETDKQNELMFQWEGKDYPLEVRQIEPF